MLMHTLSNRRRKEIGKLSRKKYRRDLGETIVEGVRSVQAAIEAGASVREIVVTRSAREDDRVARLSAASEVPVVEVEEEVMAHLSGVATPPGVLAAVRADFAPPERMQEAESVLFLDRVSDPGNAGTLLRTAAWFGVELVAAGPGTVDLFHPKVMRAAMGAHWDLELMEVENLTAAIRAFRERGGRCFGADLEGTSARRWMPEAPSALVLGSEAHGLDPELAGLLDGRVRLPPAAGREGVESLNVAMAGSILIYEWTRSGSSM